MFAPQTFDDRGLAIPFTTPKLSLARVRRNRRDVQELLIPYFADAPGTYVVPWSTLPEMMSLTLHDRQLHEELSKLDAFTPNGVRWVCLKVGAQGLAGPDVAESCRRRLASEAGQQLVANYSLIQRVYEHVGFDATQLTPQSLQTDWGRKQTKSAFEAMAKKLHTTPDALYANLSEQSTVLAQVGLAEAAQPGRLRQVAADVTGFASSVWGWVAQTVDERRYLGKIVGGVAEQTAAVADGLLGEIDVLLADIGQLMSNWAANSRALEERIDRLCWLLDCWDMLVVIWRTAADGQEVDRALAVEEIHRALPAVPRRELERLPRTIQAKGERRYERRIYPCKDSRYASPELEAKRRIETAKAGQS